MSNQGTGVNRLRVRKIGADTGQKIWISSQRCLAVPHIGEALDRFGQKAFFGYFDLATYRELHFGHVEPRRGVQCTDRCVTLDAVPVDQPVGPDEIEVK